MPNTNSALPIVCPKCHHEGCVLVVRSFTVMTVRCASCHHAWATDFNSLSAEIQTKVDAVLQDH
jgi:transcription elongation factor Elf1